MSSSSHRPTRPPRPPPPPPPPPPPTPPPPTPPPPTRPRPAPAASPAAAPPPTAWAPPVGPNSTASARSPPAPPRPTAPPSASPARPAPGPPTRPLPARHDRKARPRAGNLTHRPPNPWKPRALAVAHPLLNRARCAPREACSTPEDRTDAVAGGVAEHLSGMVVVSDQVETLGHQLVQPTFADPLAEPTADSCAQVAEALASTCRTVIERGLAPQCASQAPYFLAHPTPPC